MILGPDGKPAQKEVTNCSCGLERSKFVPSCGFGAPYMVCPACGKEYKEILCQPIASS